jgi:plasmid maintenance system killer protein
VSHKFFRDERTRLVHRTGPVPGVPELIVQRAMRGLAVIRAAEQPSDARIVGHGRVAKLSDSPLRFGVHLADQWWISFGWENGKAVDIYLEKRT